MATREEIKEFEDAAIVGRPQFSTAKKASPRLAANSKTDAVVLAMEDKPPTYRARQTMRKKLELCSASELQIILGYDLNDLVATIISEGYRDTASIIGVSPAVLSMFFQTDPMRQSIMARANESRADLMVHDAVDLATKTHPAAVARAAALPMTANAAANLLLKASKAIRPAGAKKTVPVIKIIQGDSSEVASQPPTANQYKIEELTDDATNNTFVLGVSDD